MKLKNIKEKTKTYYSQIGEIYCPYFKEKIYFDNRGFKHLFYKGGSKTVPRQKSESNQRIKILHLAPKLVSITTTLQEFEKRKGNIKYWGFIAILKRKKFKVIVRQIGTGNKHFWSIFPNWVTRKKEQKRF